MTPRTPSYQMHDGFRMPMGFPVAGFASGLQYRARAGDIFVATYPKCGTTWMQHIVYMLLHDGLPLPPERSMTDAIPHLEEVGSEKVAALDEPRAIKTHLPFDMTPYHAGAKYIYVARNPFDCVVSFYHHTRGFVKHYDFAEGSFDDYFECFMRGEVDFGDYFDNLVPWCERQRDENVLFVTYEQMQAAGPEIIATVGRFLGRSLGRDPAAAGVLREIARHTSFASMRENQQRWSSDRPLGMPEFVRRGIVGDWRRHFSAEQAMRLAAKFIARTRGTRAGALWRDIIGDAQRWPGRNALKESTYGARDRD